MPRVEFTHHLRRFFPALPTAGVSVDGAAVRELVASLDALHPGMARYLTDESGHLRKHVALYMGDAPIADRPELSDPVPPTGTLFVFQALSGG